MTDMQGSILVNAPQPITEENPVRDLALPPDGLNYIFDLMDYQNDKKEAKQEYNQEYYQKNKEAIWEYYQENKESKQKYSREYYQENKESIQKYRREYYQENKEAKQENSRKYNHKSRHGVVKEQQLGHLYNMQGGNCLWCMLKIEIFSGSTKMAMVLDHCHSTNINRAVVHNQCNIDLNGVEEWAQDSKIWKEYMDRVEKTYNPDFTLGRQTMRANNTI